METMTAIESPLERWTRHHDALIALLTSLTNYALTPDQVEVLSEAEAWHRTTRYDVERRERAWNTRYFCQLCYHEIPQGEQQAKNGQRGHFHAVCAHLVGWSDDALPKVRARLARGTYVHAADCFDHEQRGHAFYGREGGCPIIDRGEPLPSIGTKPVAFELPRDAR